MLEDNRKNYILRLFKRYSNDEMLNSFKKETIYYYTLVISELYTKEILKSNNRKYLLNNKKYVEYYHELCECMKYRGLNHLVDYSNVEITIDNIMDILRKNLKKEKSNIDKLFNSNYTINNNIESSIKLYKEYADIINDLKNGYLLIGTLNLLNVPGFVFPVFRKDGKYYFESASNGQMIDSFFEITREDILKMIKILNLDSTLKNIKMIYNVGDAPIAAYLFNEELFISDTESMIEFVDSLDIKNEIMLRKIETFKEDVKGNYEKRK